MSGALSGPRSGTWRRPGRAMLMDGDHLGRRVRRFRGGPPLWLTLTLLAVAGAADTFTVVFRGTIVQEITPERCAAGSSPLTSWSAWAAAQE